MSTASKQPGHRAKKGAAAKAAAGGETTGLVIRFTATLHQPTPDDAKRKANGSGAGWTFLNLPREASAKLASRSMVSVQGHLNGAAFQATLEPDGRGGHWMKVERKVREAAGAKVGDEVALEISPTLVEPEPKVPADLKKALAAATAAARGTWADITPMARRDWIHWIVSAKQEATRGKRIVTACDMLSKGKRRPCCFDRSGMYGKNGGSMSCPTPMEM